MKPVAAIVEPANARHGKATPPWGTPAEWVEMSRVALGGRIDLDPMSEASFQRVVRAERFYTEKQDAFRQSWACETMLLNAAGCSYGALVKAWRMLAGSWWTGIVQRAIWIGFAVDQLNVLADEPFHPDDFSKLTVRKRISFVRHDGYEGSPSHANYVVGIGVDRRLFESAFAGRGRISHGKHATRHETPNT